MAGLTIPANGILVLDEGTTTTVDDVTDITSDTWIVGHGSIIEGADNHDCFELKGGKLKITGVRFQKFDRVIYGADTQNCPHLEVQNCEFTDFNDAAINVESTIDSALIANNHIHTGEGLGIRLGNNVAAKQAGRKRIVLQGNLIHGITQTNAASTWGMIVYGHDVVIAGNLIEDINAAANQEGHCIYTKAYHAAISGNVCADVSGGSSMRGISVKGAYRSEASGPYGYQVAVTGNVCRDVPTGLRIENGEVAVAGNCVDVLSTGADGYLAADPSSGRIAIVGNVARKSGATGAGVNLNGDGEGYLAGCNVTDGFGNGVKTTTASTMGSTAIVGNHVHDSVSGILVKPAAGATITAAHVAANMVSKATADGIKQDGASVDVLSVAANLTYDTASGVMLVPDSGATVKAANIAANTMASCSVHGLRTSDSGDVDALGASSNLTYDTVDGIRLDPAAATTNYGCVHLDGNTIVKASGDGIEYSGSGTIDDSWRDGNAFEDVTGTDEKITNAPTTEH